MGFSFQSPPHQVRLGGSFPRSPVPLLCFAGRAICKIQHKTRSGRPKGFVPLNFRDHPVSLQELRFEAESPFVASVVPSSILSLRTSPASARYEEWTALPPPPASRTRIPLARHRNRTSSLPVRAFSTMRRSNSDQFTLPQVLSGTPRQPSPFVPLFDGEEQSLRPSVLLAETSGISFPQTMGVSSTQARHRLLFHTIPPCSKTMTAP